MGKSIKIFLKNRHLVGVFMCVYKTVKNLYRLDHFLINQKKKTCTPKKVCYSGNHSDGLDSPDLENSVKNC